MKNFILSISLAFYAFSAQADVRSAMQQIDRQEKGPFGLNMLQGPAERYAVTDGRHPGNLQFQAAFRNDVARAVAEKEGIYLGNLFTTNYYELTGEFVYNDAYGSHPLDHAALAAQGHRAIGKATTMVQHWVLEKHYIEQFPNSKLARAFQMRGISGAEFEQPYAIHFLNFYLGAMDGDFQYLAAFLLATNSPIVGSSSLGRARDLIATAYDALLERFGQSDARVRDFFKLRNSIHNQVSPSVIGEIDQYLRKHPFYLAEGNTYLTEIKGILQDYYSFSAASVAKQAEKAGLRDLKAAAERITSQGASPQTLLELSRAGAAWRTNISDSTKLPANKRAITLALLADVSRLLNKELAALAQPNSAEVGEAVVNTIYIEGFLIKDNWEYFKGELAAGNLAKGLADVVEVAGSATLEEAFKPVYAQWLAMEPKMQYFLDNTIKSSAVSTASTLIEKLRR